MRIGFDVDGILADFVRAYQMAVVKFADGVDLFLPGDITNPPTWDWPEHRGYSKDVTKRVWKHIIEENQTFWFDLGRLEGMRTLALMYPDLVQRHDIYFITSRPSNFGAKAQTERWLQDSGVWNPTVLISSDKGGCCAALKLDAYIDDYDVNVEGVLRKSPDTKMFLLERNYNGLVDAPADANLYRVKTVGQMFDYLLLEL